MTNLFVQMFVGLIRERNPCVVLDQLSGIQCCQIKLSLAQISMFLKLLCSPGFQTTADVNYVRSLCQIWVMSICLNNLPNTFQVVLCFQCFNLVLIYRLLYVLYLVFIGNCFKIYYLLIKDCFINVCYSVSTLYILLFI